MCCLISTKPSRAKESGPLLPLLALSAVAGAAELPADHAEKMARGSRCRKDVAPLLREHCVKCHGGEKTKSDFDLATREGLLRGVRKGRRLRLRLGREPLMKLIRHEESRRCRERRSRSCRRRDREDRRVDRSRRAVRLHRPSPERRRRGRSVVSDERTEMVVVPAAREGGRRLRCGASGGCILLEAANAKRLALNPPADARTLIRRRRSTYRAAADAGGLGSRHNGKHGVPRTYEAASTDSSDSPPKASAGRAWASTSRRFAESSGFEHAYDRPHAFHYRDFVIKALNADCRSTSSRAGRSRVTNCAGRPAGAYGTGFLGAASSHADHGERSRAHALRRARRHALDDRQRVSGLSVGLRALPRSQVRTDPTNDYTGCYRVYDECAQQTSTSR